MRIDVLFGAHQLVFRLRAQPLVPKLIDLAALVQCNQGLIDLGEQGRLVLLHADADRFEEHRILDHLEFDSALF